jgi:hypothetical protein
VEKIMILFSSKRKLKLCAAIVLLSLISFNPAQGAIQTFNMVDKAINYTGITPITATSGQQIPGGTDNTAAQNEFNISFLQFDFDGDSLLDPEAEDPTIYYDFQVYTGVPSAGTGGQISFGGFHKTFSPALTGSYVMSSQIDPPEPAVYNQPFPVDGIIGDGLNEFTRKVPLNSLAVDEGGLTTFMQPGVDNFIGFQLQTGNYGWIRAQYDNTAPGTLTFLDGAYDDTGAPIAAGDTGGMAVNDADFDGDGDIDGRDFLIWQRGFDLTGQVNNSSGDANGDTVVDGLDLTVWQDQYGGTPLSASISRIPEPASLALFGACFVVASLRRSR